MKNRATVRLLSGLALTGVVTCAAAAQDAIPEALRACATVKRNSERLACYDEAIEHLSAGSNDTAKVIAPSPERMFGTPRAKPPKAETTDSAIAREDLASVTAHISGLSNAADGSAVIELDNGQTWQQISGSSLLLEVGHEVTITRAALNSFRLIAPTGRSAKVRRLR